VIFNELAQMVSSLFVYAVDCDDVPGVHIHQYAVNLSAAESHVSLFGSPVVEESHCLGNGSVNGRLVAPEGLHD
jgi:hypothetical protein